MTLGEMLKVDPKLFSDNESIYCNYWEMEMALAELDNLPYCDIYMSDPIYRSCGICGKAYDTDERGGLPNECDDETCKSVREYFSIGMYSNDIRTPRFRKSKYNVRYEWLTNKLRNSGQQPIGHMSGQARFNVLLTAMLERICFEKAMARGEFSQIKE